MLISLPGVCEETGEPHECVFEERPANIICVDCGMCENKPILWFMKLTLPSRDLYAKTKQVSYFEKMYSLMTEPQESVLWSTQFKTQFFAKFEKEKIPNWYQVYRWLRSVDQKELLFLIPTLFGVSIPRISEMLEVFFLCQWKKLSKNNLIVVYVVFKTMQLYRHPMQHWVPLHLGQRSLTRLDTNWKHLCEEYGWFFIPTSPVDANAR